MAAVPWDVSADRARWDFSHSIILHVYYRPLIHMLYTLGSAELCLLALPRMHFFFSPFFALAGSKGSVGGGFFFLSVGWVYLYIYNGR